MKRLFLSIALLLSLFMAGCAVKTPAAAEIEESLKKDETNAKLHLKLAYEYYKAGIKANNKYSIRKAYESANKAYELEPENMEIKIFNYNVTVLYVELFHDNIALAKVKDLYLKLDKVDENTQPPSYVEYVFKYNLLTTSKREKYALLKSAIKENKQFLPTYVDLAQLYVIDGYDKMAMDVVKRALKNTKDSFMLHYFALNVYYDKLDRIMQSQDCVYKHKKLLKVTVKESKKVLHYKDNIEMAYVAALYSYEHLGRFRLALDMARKNHEKFNNEYSKFHYAYEMLNLSPEMLFKKMQKEYIDENIPLAYMYLLQWGQYFDVMQKQTDTLTASKYIYMAYAKSKAESLKKAREFLKENMQYIKKDNWYNTVAEYFLGNISEDELLKDVKQDSICKGSEAYFAIGFLAYVQGDMQKAKENFKTVIDKKAYGYVEYHMAKKLVETIVSSQL